MSSTQQLVVTFRILFFPRIPFRFFIPPYLGAVLRDDDSGPDSTTWASFIPPHGWLLYTYV